MHSSQEKLLLNKRLKDFSIRQYPQLSSLSLRKERSLIDKELLFILNRGSVQSGKLSYPCVCIEMGGFKPGLWHQTMAYCNVCTMP